MKRRTCLGTILSILGAGQTVAQNPQKSIELNVDLAVDPAKENEMLHLFHGEFRAAAAKQPGFIDAQMLKLRTALQGAAPPSANYRFVLRFKSEEQRQAWVASSLHQKLWPRMEQSLTSKQYTVLLYDLS
jgi:antibiotic biosynthesis monooxygenase (ABM) superfamily enzyme